MRILFFVNLPPDFVQVGNHFFFGLAQTESTGSANLLLESAEVVLPGLVLDLRQVTLDCLTNEINQIRILQLILRPNELAV